MTSNFVHTSENHAETWKWKSILTWRLFRKGSPILYFRTWTYFRAFWSNRWESSNFVVLDVDGTREEVSGTGATRLLGLMDWQRCYNCFSNGFPLDAFSLSFGSVTCSIIRGNKIEREELILLLSIRIRINVGHFFFSMMFRLSHRLLGFLFTLWVELLRYCILSNLRYTCNFW